MTKRLQRIPLSTAAFVLAMVPVGAAAQTYRIIRTFGGNPGITPYDYGRLVLYKGKLFGTTSEGYAGNSLNGGVFKVDPQSRRIVPFYTFRSSAFDGGEPFAAPIADAAGNLYGVTSNGGVPGPGLNGFGTVYKISQDGVFTLLHTFTWPDGAIPTGPVYRDGTGNLYGTTGSGGTAKNTVGTVFRVDASGNLTTLHNFDGPDGYQPSGAVVVYRNKLYSTTQFGGRLGAGVVFRIDLKTLDFKVLHSFSGGDDGSLPVAGLIRRGNTLYGTTTYGGSAANGVAYAIDIKTGQETVLHSFLGSPSDGSVPMAQLLADAQGSLYGTTAEGGSQPCNCGTIFKIDASGNYTVLYNFEGHARGSTPESGLVMDKRGILYGVTAAGGQGLPYKQGPGVIYELTP